ncbi:MAG: phosphate ABC transporter substrate-binding protein PstS [Gemmatimonadales bacterium]|jgi:phosphate transport system substrate-binding protein
MRSIFGVTAAAVAGLVAIAGSLSAQAEIRVTGAGATFPNPIYSKWVLEYTVVRPHLQINYQAIGSGGGIRQFSDHTVDFGATDGPMTDSQITVVHGNVYHLPTVLGAVVPTYNIPGVTAQLRFTGDVLAGIFLGQITKWNDSRITGINPGVNLPDQDIVVAHRSDGSGTTYIWSDYLSKVSQDWAQRVGKGTSVNWPVGLGGQGNPGVANIVKQTPGAIGYVELIYAVQNNIGYGLVRNKAGNYIQASLEATTAAAAAVVAALDENTDFRVSITDADAAQAYPIASFTWLLVPQQMSDPTKARALLEFVWWAVHDGQKYCAGLSYAPLPSRVVQLEEQRLKSVTVNGRPVLPANYRGR